MFDKKTINDMCRDRSKQIQQECEKFMAQVWVNCNDADKTKLIVYNWGINQASSNRSSWSGGHTTSNMLEQVDREAYMDFLNSIYFMSPKAMHEWAAEHGVEPQKAQA